MWSGGWNSRDLEVLFREHGPSLHAYLARLSGDQDMAADGVQEAFVRLAESGSLITSPRAWLFRVATRLALEWRRTDARRARLLSAAPDGAALGDAPASPAEMVEQDETRRITQAALAALPQRDRMVLLLQAEGFTHREIAAAVGTTTGSVGTMIARAMQKLAAELHANRGGAA